MSSTERDAAHADQMAALEAARAEATRVERNRIAAILRCENAKGREAAAIDMALDEETAFSGQTANTLLARFPLTAVADIAQSSRIPSLEQRARESGPEIGSDFSERSGVVNPIAEIYRQQAKNEAKK